MQKAVLNVGGGTKSIAIAPRYAQWRHDLLDIDPAVRPDVLLDARRLTELAAQSYDAVWCSNNIEHYCEGDALKVLRGFVHVLKPAGFAEIRVPDLVSLFRHVVAKGVELTEPLYFVAGAPITLRDVIYGYGAEIERSGNSFYAHKSGYSPSVLREMFAAAGFRYAVIGPPAPSEMACSMYAVAFKNVPDEAYLKWVLTGQP